MKTETKKFISLLISLAVILTALPLAGVTAFAEKDGDFEYTILEDGSAEITDYTGNAETLEIPSTIDGYTVVSIDWFAFSGCDSLTSVTIPESVESIGYDAFYGCDSLTSVTIPKSVTSIGGGAFGWCHSLTEIKADSNNKNYTSQDGVLFNKNKTELIQYPAGKSGASYDIPNSVTSIGDDAFGGCNNLTSVTIPNSVESIGYNAFYGCDSLTSITIPDSVTSIGGGAFDDTGYYNNPSNWENGVLYMNNCLVDTKIDEVPENYKINEGTRVIAEQAFIGCGLTSVTIPNSVTSIGLGAFYDCSKLTSVTIPDSVTSIGDEAFSHCDSLTDIYILNKECNINSNDGYEVTIPYETTIHGYAGSTAESYAREHGNKFIRIGDVQETHNMEQVPAKAATCTEDGNIEYYHCSECNKNFKDKDGNEEVTVIVVKATGHNMGEKVEAKAATCTEDGNIEYYHCSTCNKNFKDINGNEEVTDVVVKATGHTLGEKVAAKAATCTEDGNIEYYHCSTCNKNFKDKDGKEEVADVVVKATGHKYENGVCTVCGEKDPNASKPSGEVSGDGKLSTVDAKWILQNIAKSRDFSDEQSKAADLNGDGKLSVVDVKWVLQIVAGMRDAETLELITK